MTMTFHRIGIVLPAVVVLAAAVTAQSPASAPRANAVLWVDPVDLPNRDLRAGLRTPDHAPAPPFNFLKEDTSGTQPKFKVRDGRGVEWTVKLGPEAQSETAATRLVWAAGYFADENYFVPEATIGKLPALGRGAADFTRSGGIVIDARFEAEREEAKSLGKWEWEENPFLGTRELNGLKVLMMLLNNWDARDDNNRIVRVTTPDGTQDRYMVSDLGATFGKTGGLGSHSKNDVKDYVSSDFVDGVEQGFVKFHYKVRPKGLGMLAILYPPHLGRINDIEQTMSAIKVDDARWIGSVLSRISEAQMRDAFAAAHYDEPTIALYVTEVRDRIRQLTSLGS
jgi:hypothetical protein